MGNLIKSNDYNNKQLSADKVKEEENNSKKDTTPSSLSSPATAAFGIGQNININTRSTSTRSNRRIELTTKLLNFRKISSRSIGSLSQRTNLNLSGLLRKSTNSISSNTSTNRRYSQKYQKSVWPSSLKDSLFSSHFKHVSKNNEYCIESVVANGAFGVVLKVVNRAAAEKQENYAIKVLEKSRIVEDNAVQQIKDEIDIQKLCSHHPFIVKYFDCWQNRSNLFILLEYISCGELFTRIRKFPYELIQLYVAEIATALDFLHNAGVIYRDVKPENILLNYYYHIKLTDFGLSKWLKFGNKTRTICGTFQYMAPEILIGSPYGHSVDWWALGVVACRMFTNKYPNTRKLIAENGQIYDLISRITSSVNDNDDSDDNDVHHCKSSQFLPKDIATIPKEGQDLIRKLLEYDPLKRIKSVTALQKIAMYKNFKIDMKSLLKLSPINIMKNHNIFPEEDGNDLPNAAKDFEGF